MVPSTAAMAANYKAKSTLEIQLEAELNRQGLTNEAQIAQREEEDLLRIMPGEEYRARKDKMMVKNMLFRQEIKNKRLSKIKSKLYHKIKKRTKNKEETKLLEQLQQIDPEAAKEYRDT
jgi:U3 small nucleolar RNA-associated protein 14